MHNFVILLDSPEVHLIALSDPNYVMCIHMHMLCALSILLFKSLLESPTFKMPIGCITGKEWRMYKQYYWIPNQAYLAVFLPQKSDFLYKTTLISFIYILFDFFMIIFINVALQYLGLQISCYLNETAYSEITLPYCY